jgi:exopolysaccharide biosynthesis polyprenyl glycosylphosphotransferase
MKNNISLLYGLVLVVGDFLALLVAFILAYILRVSISHRPLTAEVHASTYIEIFLLLVPFFILVFALLGLYNSSIYERRFREAGRVMLGSFISVLFIISYAYAVNRAIFPARLVPVYGFVLSFLFIVIFRNLARYLRSKMFKYDLGITNLLIVGNTKVARELVESLLDARVSGYRIVGVVGDSQQIIRRFPDIKAFDDFDSAVKKLNSDDIHGIVQTELYSAADRNNEILEFSQKNHIAYRFIPGNSELFVGNIHVELFRGSIPVIAVHQTALIGWGRIVKRFEDLLIAGFFFIILLPVMLVIAVLIKIMDFHGPVLYKDKRLTRFGHAVTIYKFRTIKQAYGGPPETGFKKLGRPELIAEYRRNGDWLPDDPRFSKIGRFLWHSSLDELPQLFNVVKGDISLVGPRALHPAELEHFDKKDLILTVKSGLTGLAQVSGRRSISFDERRKLDLFYVQNWTAWLDLTIIIKTLRVVFRRIGES